MNDRFAELGPSEEIEMDNLEYDGRKGKKNSDSDGSDIDSDDDDVEKQSGQVIDEAAHSELAPFFKDVEEMKQSMDKISDNIATIKRIYAEILTTTSTEQAQELRQEAGGVRTETDSVAQQMRSKLKKMRKENDDFVKSHDNDPSLEKIRTNMHGTLVRKFLDLMQQYQQVLTKYDKKIREKAYRQVQLVSPEADPADIDEVLDQGGDVTEGIFSKQILEDRKHQKAKQTLDYLKERQNVLINLEKSIIELNQLFMDMSILVETQGDLIDQIEYSVVNSKAYTERAVKTLAETEKIVISTRKRKCCIVITVIIIIALVVLIIAIVSGVIPPVISSIGG